MIKIDAQGGELNILKGATECLKHASYLIVGLQNVNYNDGAPMANVVIDWLTSVGWVLIVAKFRIMALMLTTAFVDEKLIIIC